jgi:hypothetical protein
MRSLRTPILIAVLLLCGCSMASATPILDGWAINMDGLIFTSFINTSSPATGADLAAAGGTVPGGKFSTEIGYLDAGTIDWASGAGQIAGGMGLGEIDVSFIGSGTHTVTLWMDHHLDFGFGPVFFDESGAVVNGLPAGYAYTIDEPGYGDQNGYTGTAYAQTQANSLDNTNHQAAGGPVAPSDVSMAISITSTVAPGKYGTKWRFVLGYSSPDYTNPGFVIPAGFNLQQVSEDGVGTLYFSASVEDIPEPGGWALSLGGALMIAGIVLRRRQAGASR